MDERIDDYFGQRLSQDEKIQFEAEIKTNPELAEAVAIYMAARDEAIQLARKKQLEERHVQSQTLRKQSNPFIDVRIWYAAAAVALISLGVFWYWVKTSSKDMRQMAEGYTMEHFTTLSVEMGANPDSIQIARNEYNNGQYATALKICEGILKRDQKNAEAKIVGGIVSLKLLDYDKAIAYFSKLGNQSGLYANPGRFYEAITFLKRGMPGDEEKARRLLQEVIDQDLEGKKEAEKWLD